MDTAVISTTRPMENSSVITESASEATSADSTTTSLTVFSQWYDEHFFEGVEYNPDVVQSLSLADISPKDFLSAEDIKLDDSGFWSSSSDVSPTSTGVSKGMMGSGHAGDLSPCFSNASDDNHSDIFASNDWVDTIVLDCFDLQACHKQQATNVTSTLSVLPDVIIIPPPDVTQKSPPDATTFPSYSYPVSRKRKRDVFSINTPELDIDGNHLAHFHVVEHTTQDTGRVVTDVQTLTSDDSEPASCDKTTTFSDKKPLMSYLTMIAMAILFAPQKRSLLNDIYKFVIRNFPYYERCKSAWRNSVRHNLSVNECFVKNGRAPSGRGFYWAIHPACLDDFKRGDFNRRQARCRAQTNFRMLEVYRQRAQVACSSHAAAQQDYYMRMSSTPARQTDVYDSQPTPPYLDGTDHQGYYTNYWC